MLPVYSPFLKGNSGPTSPCRHVLTLQFSPRDASPSNRRRVGTTSPRESETATSLGPWVHLRLIHSSTCTHAHRHTGRTVQEAATAIVARTSTPRSGFYGWTALYLNCLFDSLGNCSCLCTTASLMLGIELVITLAARPGKRVRLQHGHSELLLLDMVRGNNVKKIESKVCEGVVTLASMNHRLGDLPVVNSNCPSQSGGKTRWCRVRENRQQQKGTQVLRATVRVRCVRAVNKRVHGVWLREFG